ncbi:MAG: DUF5811 family protein [Halobacteriaceae archaeon]
MNGNTPYAGPDGTVEAGRRAPPELSADQRRALRATATRIAARTREYLPGEYTVGAEVTAGADGARATVAVQPPIGNPVTAGFEPEADGHAEPPMPDEDRDEVARGLAASAALQVKQALDDREIDPVAR